MPLMKQNEVVPFGKYKGKPIEQLAADPDYCDWLMQQSWFAEMHPAIHTLIINNFGEPSETPEHNRLQLRFLDETFRRQCLRAAGVKGFYQAQPIPDFEVGGVDVRWAILSWRLVIEEKTETIATVYKDEYERLCREATQAASRYEHSKSLLRTSPEYVEKLIKELDRRKQERFPDYQIVEANRRVETAQEAWEEADSDIYDQEEAMIRCAAARDAHAYEYSLVFANKVIKTSYEWHRQGGEYQGCPTIGIECKPVLGDDYPAVLRFMRNIRGRPSLYCLVIGALRSQAASMDQLRLVFAQANILLLSVPEIESIIPPPAWEKDELPNPLEDESFIASNSYFML